MYVAEQLAQVLEVHVADILQLLLHQQAAVAVVEAASCWSGHRRPAVS